jgi:hypothetical protein
MPIVPQSEFDRLVRIGAVNQGGEVQYSLNFDGVRYLPGGELFSAGNCQQPNAKRSTVMAWVSKGVER